MTVDEVNQVPLDCEHDYGRPSQSFIKNLKICA